MSNMAMQHRMWKKELSQGRLKVVTAPGDALVTAACVCYHGPLTRQARMQLLHDWLISCKNGHFIANFPSSGHQIETIGGHLESNSSVSQLLMATQHRRESQNEAMSNGDKSSMLQDSSFTSKMARAMPNTARHSAPYDPSIHFDADTPEPMADDRSEDSRSTGGQTVNLLQTRPNFSLPDVLSSFEELSVWKKQNLSMNAHAIENALIMRVCCKNRKHCWPLLVDTEGEAETWVRFLQNSKNTINEEDLRIPIEDFGKWNGQYAFHRIINGHCAFICIV